MLITNETIETNFRSAFETNLNTSNSVRIASGYFGVSEIIRYKERFCEIARDGGDVQLIHGMGGSEGIRQKLYEELRDLDNTLKGLNSNNRVFIHKSRYHGKMYITDNEDGSQVLIGSSNFSGSGFSTNLELNYCHSGQNLCNEARDLFDRLKSNSVQIDKINLPDKAQEEMGVRTYEFFDPNVFNRAPDTTIDIRITHRSNLNLFLSRGRLIRETGVYTPRPFYEVELTIGAHDRTRLHPYIPNQLEPAEFQAVTDLGTTFTVKFKRKTNDRDDARTLHQLGIDFMSSPRKALGQYMKGKLMDAGLLSYGEPITEETLIEYGTNQLSMYFCDDGKLYLKF